LVVRKPGSRAKLHAALVRALPFEAQVMLCEGRDLIRLEKDCPFGAKRSGADIVRFVSIFSKAGRCATPIPFSLPPEGQWLVRVIASESRFVFGMYRRHMKTIGYLGRLDKLFGAQATTRNWNTILAVLRILKGRSNARP